MKNPSNTTDPEPRGIHGPGATGTQPDTRRLRVLTDLARALSTAENPREIVELFVRAMRDAYGPSGYVSLNVKGLPPGHFRVVRFLTHDGEDLVEAGDLVRAGEDGDGPVYPVRSGGFFATLIDTPEPKLRAHLDVPVDPVAGDLLGEYGSAVAVPIYERGEIASWAVLLRRAAGAFDLAALEDAVLRVNLLGASAAAAESARRLESATRALHREVDAIAEIQRALLPPTNPRIPGLRLAASYETFDRAGGDYYAFIPTRESAGGAKDLTGPWAVFIADVSGHGPSAAVIASMMHAILNAAPFDFAGPAEALEHLNRTLFERPLGASFVTAFMGVYDPRERTLDYARAGHPPPILKQRGHDGEVSLLDGHGGLPLGVTSEVGARDARVRLEPNQTIVLYTDGLTEALSPDGRQLGLAGVQRALRACSGEPACVINSLREALLAHQAGRRPSDDQTVVAMAVD